MKLSNQHNKRLERLIGIENAIHRVPRSDESYDDRLLGVVETLTYHLGVLQDAHNTMAHGKRIEGNTKKEPVSSGLILPPGMRR